jgi:hypothetical protein
VTWVKAANGMENCRSLDFGPTARRDRRDDNKMGGSDSGEGPLDGTEEV